MGAVTGLQGNQEMSHSMPPQKSRPSPWAFGLLFASSGFAMLAIWLIATT